MLTALFVLTGISLAFTAVAWFFDRETEEEKARQDRIRQSYAEFLHAHQDDRKVILNQYVHVVLNEVHAERSYMYEVATNLRSKVKDLRDVLNNEQFTPTRKSALRTILRKLEIKKEQAFAKVSYLLWLDNQIRTAAQNGREIGEVELSLPEDFPFVGKVLYVPRSELSSKGSLRYADYVMDEHGIPENDGEIPLFVTNYSREDKLYVLSAVKGLLGSEFLSSSGTSISATVNRVEKGQAGLDFLGIALRLDRRDQVDRSWAPVRGSRMEVYPVDWNFDLSPLRKNSDYVVQVSERWEASIRESHFDEVALVVPEASMDEFVDQCKSLGQSTEPWIMQPSAEWDGDSETLTSLTLQNGDLSLRVIIENHEEAPRLVFDRILPAGDGIKAGGIFAQFFVPLVAISASELATADDHDKWRESFAELQLFLGQEFRNQWLIRRGHEGALYFQRWGHVLDGLIRHKIKVPDKGKRADIVDVAACRGKFELKISNAEDVRSYMRGHQEKQPPVKVFYLFDGDSRLGRLWGDNVEEDLFHLQPFARNLNSEDLLHGEMTVFGGAHPYPEIMQRRAIESFRRGELANGVLKPTLLAPETVIPDLDQQWEPVDVNPLIMKSPHQMDILQNALLEQNIFCIQGPPGAGKTTIIVELIRQHLRKRPQDSVLVVSQSNVAVDEVLLRLAKDLGDENMVRIGGNELKIDPQIIERKIRIEQRHQDYMTLLYNTPSHQGPDELREFWLEQLGQDLGPDVAELLITRHKIVGATCVGLANHRLGLNMREFDLIIMDEAARATPGEVLIPLLRGKKIVLIGDQKQLPPTIDRSLQNEEFPLQIKPPQVRAMYAESIFERLFNGLPNTHKAMLDKQFRMPPAIGRIVSRMFYEEKGASVLACGKSEEQPLYFAHPLTWLDTSQLKGYAGRSCGTSLYNPAEIDLVMRILGLLVRLRSHVQSTEKIVAAVITSYSEQKWRIRKRFSERFKEPLHSDGLQVRIDTVDAFQGNQAEVVIYCTTRHTGNIGFINDANRLNVAISRSKREFICIGSKPFLAETVVQGRPNLFATMIDEMTREGATFVTLRSGKERELRRVLAQLRRA